MKKIFVSIVTAALLVFAGSPCQLFGATEWKTAVDLSADGRANCYVVTAPGFYCFDVTVIGNGQEGIIPGVGFHTEDAAINPVSARILFNQNDVLSDVSFGGGKVYFRAGDKEGNAQIAVYDAAGEVLWSWHIWRTDAPEDIAYTNRDKISWVVMDRNIGATASSGDEAQGLYYQWGRKDPFEASVLAKGMYVNKDRNLAYAVKHPRQALKPIAWKGVYDTFDWSGNHRDSINQHLWGNPDFAYCHPLKEMVKTIYDPCPAGYVVAPSNAFIDFEMEERLEFADNGFWFKADASRRCFFPFGGGIYTGVKLDRPEMPVGASSAVWNSASARFIYWDDGGSRSVVYKDTHEARNYYGDTRTCCYQVRCVRQAK